MIDLAKITRAEVALQAACTDLRECDEELAMMRRMIGRHEFHRRSIEDRIDEALEVLREGAELYITRVEVSQ